jgi:hypothetical protein
MKQALKYFFEQIYFLGLEFDFIWGGFDFDRLLKKIKIVNLHENGETLLGEMRFHDFRETWIGEMIFGETSLGEKRFQGNVISGK